VTLNGIFQEHASTKSALQDSDFQSFREASLTLIEVERDMKKALIMGNNEIGSVCFCFCFCSVF
jgi:hypothetical protein